MHLGARARRLIGGRRNPAAARRAGSQRERERDCQKSGEDRRHKPRGIVGFGPDVERVRCDGHWAWESGGLAQNCTKCREFRLDSPRSACLVPPLWDTTKAKTTSRNASQPAKKTTASRSRRASQRPRSNAGFDCPAFRRGRERASAPASTCLGESVAAGVEKSSADRTETCPHLPPEVRPM